MADVIQLEVNPSAAILNSNDSALPEKTRTGGTNQPRFSLKCNNTDTVQRAFWAWPIARQSRIGTIPGTGKLRLHYTANTTDTDNVGFTVKSGFVKNLDQIDKALVEQSSGSKAFGGVANAFEYQEFDLADMLDGVALSESGWLVVCVERDNTIGDNLGRVVELLKSVLELDFISKLEVNGPVIVSVPVTDPIVILTPDLLGHHIIVDTTVIGLPALVLMASDTSVEPITADHDGYSYFISKIGPHQVDIDVDPGLAPPSTDIRGGPRPFLLVSDGDSVRMSYTSYDDKYQVW